MSVQHPKNKIQIHCHIERTAGTFLIGEFEKMYGSKHVLLYKTQKEKLVRVSDIPLSPASPVVSWVKTTFGGMSVLKGLYKVYLKATEIDTPFVKWISASDIPEDTKVISGHFEPDKFKFIDNAFYTVVLREPLERMISQYLHWKRSGGPGWRLVYPYSDEGFTKYALWERHHNFQTKAMGSYKLDNFDFVGVTKHLDIFVDRLKGNESMPMEKQEVTRVNKIKSKPKYDDLGIDNDFIKVFKRLNSEDYSNYETALRWAIDPKV